MITLGRQAIPKIIRTNCITATAELSAPISMAISGVSVMPPGAAQKRQVSRSRSVIWKKRAAIPRSRASRLTITIR